MVGVALFPLLILGFMTLLGFGLLLSVVLPRRRALGVGLLTCSLLMLATLAMGLLFFVRSASQVTVQSQHTFHVGEAEWLSEHPQSLQQAVWNPAVARAIPERYPNAVVTPATAMMITLEDVAAAEQATVETATRPADAGAAAEPTGTPLFETDAAADNVGDQGPATAVAPVEEVAVPADAAGAVTEEQPPASDTAASEVTASDVTPTEVTAETGAGEAAVPEPVVAAEPAIAAPPTVVEHAPATAAPAAAETAPAAPPATIGGELSNPTDLESLQTGPLQTPAHGDADLPPWVKVPPQTWNGQLATTLVSDPFDNRFDCDRDLDRKTYAALLQYVRDSGVLDGPESVGVLELSPEELAAAVKERHYLFRETSVGVMQQAYQLTVFDATLQARLQDRYRDAIARERLRSLGALAFCVLSAVGGLYGLCSLLARKSPDPFAMEPPSPGTVSAG